MKKPESRLQQKIRRRLEAKYSPCWCRKIWGGPFQTAGLPDIFFLYSGLFFGLEVKRPGRRHKASPMQLREIKLIKQAGGHAAVIESFEEADKIVQNALKAQAKALSRKRI